MDVFRPDVPFDSVVLKRQSRLLLSIHVYSYSAQSIPVAATVLAASFERVFEWPQRPRTNAAKNATTIGLVILARAG